MYGIEDVESSSKDILLEYSSRYGTDNSVLAVAAFLAEMGHLREQDSEIVLNEAFALAYQMKEYELFLVLKNKFGAEFGDLSKVEACCLFAMEYKAEPFCSYLVQNVEEKLLKKICDFNSDYPDAIVIQYIIASKLEDSKIIRQLEEQQSYLRENSILKLVQVSPEEQYSSFIRSHFVLNKIWPRSVNVDTVHPEDYNVSIRETFSLSSLKEVKPKAKDRVKKKFLKLAKLLDDNKLYLGKISLDGFGLDGTENIYINDTSELQEVDDEFPVEANFYHFKSIWEDKYGKESIRSYDDDESVAESYSREDEDYEEEDLTDLY